MEPDKVTAAASIPAALLVSLPTIMEPDEDSATTFTVAALLVSLLTIVEPDEDTAAFFTVAALLVTLPTVVEPDKITAEAALRSLSHCFRTASPVFLRHFFSASSLSFSV